MTGFIDTHCHLDAREFDADRAEVAQQASASGVSRIVIPAVALDNFDVVRSLAHASPGGAYALGIHPLWALSATPEHVERLDAAIVAAKSDTRFVAIGEIGLDLFVDALRSEEGRRQQQWLYSAQLKLARKHGLPVLLHVRRAQDLVLKGLRKTEVPGGIAHAFNGSDQQAHAFVSRGFRLGFGGAMTFERSRQIRRVAAAVDPTALVLETDSPDIPPAWLDGARNSPCELPRIAQTLADLRGWTLDQTAATTSANALAVLPRLWAVPGHA